MGFLARLFGNREVTPEQFGRSLFDVALERTRTLHPELDSMGVLARLPRGQPLKQYGVSLAIFALAPLDQLLGETPSSTTKRARVAMRQAFRETFRVQTPEPQDTVLDSILATYASTVRAGDVMELGRLATEAMGLDGDADAETLLLESYTGGLNNYSSVISEYERGSR